jgi:hypothetical protein
MFQIKVFVKVTLIVNPKNAHTLARLVLLTLNVIAALTMPAEFKMERYASATRVTTMMAAPRYANVNN